jgi:hypothetical protein
MQKHIRICNEKNIIKKKPHKEINNNKTCEHKTPKKEKSNEILLLATIE